MTAGVLLFWVVRVLRGLVLDEVVEADVADGRFRPTDPIPLEEDLRLVARDANDGTLLARSRV